MKAASKRQRKPRYVSWTHLGSQSAQQIKKVWGLGQKKHCIDLTLIGDNPLLMDMDAPDVLPAGSMVREEHPSAAAIYFSARARSAFRGD